MLVRIKAPQSWRIGLLILCSASRINALALAVAISSGNGALDAAPNGLEPGAWGVLRRLDYRVQGNGFFC